MSKERKPEEIRLAENLDITEAAPLAADLVKFRGSDIRIDASQVRKIGGQCLQVLLSGVSTSIQDGAHFEVINPSPDFTDSLEAFGLNLSFFSSQEPAL